MVVSDELELPFEGVLDYRKVYHCLALVTTEVMVVLLYSPSLNGFVTDSHICVIFASTSTRLASKLFAQHKLISDI
mgnify:FL=1